MTRAADDFDAIRRNMHRIAGEGVDERGLSFLACHVCGRASASNGTCAEHDPCSPQNRKYYDGAPDA